MRTIFLISLAAHMTLPVSTIPDEINQLDECIQKRFGARTVLGMERVARMDYHGVRQFRAENATEQSVVNGLEQKGYQVALYLAGRGVNTKPMDILAAYRYGVQGPAYITHFGDPKESPSPASLLEDGRKALASFETGGGYDIREGAWTVALRPLRASNQACVQCHSTSGEKVKIGDPIGVVMYAYKR
jgi:hypothetical protein